MHHSAACTCSGESHPGPVRSDSSYVGRSAPEIDVSEALIDPDGGKVCTSLMVLDCVERVRRSLCILWNMLLEIQTIWHFRLALSIVKRMHVGYLAEGN